MTNSTHTPAPPPPASARPSAALTDALSVALHTATPHASSAGVRPVTGKDGKPAYRATLSVDWFGEAATPEAAVDLAMQAMTAALGGKS